MTVDRDELTRLLSPLGAVAERALGLLPLWLVLLTLGWAFSGVTVIQPDEVGLVLRFGGLVGENPALAVREPGLLVAPPRPIGEVIRVPVKKVFETELRALHFDRRDGTFVVTGAPGLDPRRAGYAVTGDDNAVHVALVARYQISDPVAWALRWEDPEAALSVIIVDELGRAIGELSVDTVLTDGRSDLISTVEQRTQVRGDALGLGLSVVSLELAELVPPQQVRDEFTDVQSAAIDAETLLQTAGQYREQTLPLAASTREARIAEARASAAELLALARADAGTFRALAAEVRERPAVVRERLYREGIETPLQRAGRVRFVPPPPPGKRYENFRVTVK